MYPVRIKPMQADIYWKTALKNKLLPLVTEAVQVRVGQVLEQIITQTIREGEGEHTAPIDYPPDGETTTSQKLKNTSGNVTTRGTSPEQKEPISTDPSTKERGHEGTRNVSRSDYNDGIPELVYLLEVTDLQVRSESDPTVTNVRSFSVVDVQGLAVTVATIVGIILNFCITSDTEHVDVKLSLFAFDSLLANIGAHSQGDDGRNE